MIRRAPKSRNPVAPRAGAGQQVYLGAVTASGSRPGQPGRTGDARSAVDPLAGAKGRSYLQRDPEGGLRKVNVYNVNGRRVVRVVQNPKNVDAAALKRLNSRAKSARRGLYEAAVGRG